MGDGMPLQRFFLAVLALLAAGSVLAAGALALQKPGRGGRRGWGGRDLVRTLQSAIPFFGCALPGADPDRFAPIKKIRTLILP